MVIAPPPGLVATADAGTETGTETGTDEALTGLLGYRLRRAWMAVQADLAETLRPHDLRMITFSALVLVEANPGLSQAQLARLMAVERPNLVQIVDELETRGLVRRQRAPEDRRAYALDVTCAGRALCARALVAVRDHEARLFAGLSNAERRAVEKALAFVRRNAGSA